MSIIITLLNIMVHPFLRGDVLRCCLGNRLYLLYWHKRDHVNIVFRNFYPIKFHKMNLNRCLAPTVGTGHLSLYTKQNSVFPLPKVVSSHWLEATNYSLVHDVTG